MNVTGTVQEVSQTSQGKPKVKINGNWLFLDRECYTAPVAGQSIEYREEEFKFSDGKPGKKIMAWIPAGSKAVNPAPSPASDYIEEASLRFISNVVGSAIAAGTIKSPGQVHSWFQAAKSALIGQPAANSFDDDMPTDEAWERQQRQ